MKVYVYYEHTRDFRNDFELIGECARSWCAQGWDFEALSLATARQHPEYETLCNAIADYPTVNDRRYEDAAYRRWLALAVVGGGLLIDYDMINYALTPQTWEESTMLSESDNCPPVFVTADDADVLVYDIIGWNERNHSHINGKPHLSDMHMFELSGCFGFPHLSQGGCKTLLYRGWETAPIVHYANEHCRRVSTALTRCELIRSGRNYVQSLIRDKGLEYLD